MELPKNITQIGEVGRDCKIYVEDYVVSYMKQLNRTAQDKDIAVALYGKRREENGIVYYFVYGASKMNSLQREVRHLSQAQRQEIENSRRKYFTEQAFVGYRLLDGEMIEGFHICEQDICRYISGYAQFYEKNDAMLAYMLDVREEAAPEQVNQEKYEEVKKRQEERRIAAERPARSSQARERFAGELPDTRSVPVSLNLQKMRLTAVGVFALLCLFGIATFRDAERNRNLQAVQSANVNVQKDTLVMEDKLEQALREENNAAETQESLAGETKPEEFQSETSQPETSSPVDTQTVPVEQPSETGQDSQETEPTEVDEPTQPEETPSTQPASTGSVAYVIQAGDTLTAISMRQYGTDIRVADICNLNRISNPDDIKQGQVIMLPR